MIRKLSLTFAAAVVLFALQTAAKAETVTFSGQYNTSANVSNYSLNGNRFTFTLTNTSPSGSITAIGFNLPGDRGSYSIVSATNSNFTIGMDVKAQAGAQNFTRGEDFDFALLTGSNFGGGKVAEGVLPGQSVTFVVMGDFSDLTAEQVARSILLRFQGIGPQDQSTVIGPGPGPGPGPAPIPEPMTMILFGSGLAGVAASVRRRKAAK